MAVAEKNNLLNSLSQLGVGLGAKNQAFELLKMMEFPNRKTEDWKYTSVNKLVKKKYVQINNVDELDLSSVVIPDIDAYKVILVNGVYSDLLSDKISSNDVIVDTFPNALENHVAMIHASFNTIAKNREEIFTAINTSYFNEGIFIYVPKSTVVNKPIHVVNVNTKNEVVSNLRCLVIAERNSEVNIIQTFASEGVEECLTNSVMEVFVRENSKVAVDKVQIEEQNNSLICTEQINQERDSSFKINALIVSGDFVRNGLVVDVDGENCTTEMNGLYMQKGNQHVDNHTKVNHLKPNCTSFELYKGVLDDSATGVFNGKVVVAEDAQKIEAYQQNKNIILSKNATMNAKPELEIYADDVKCSHGTTTGQFDEEAVFYLQARGLSEKSAKRLLVEAFADEVLDKVDNEKLRDWVKVKLS